MGESKNFDAEYFEGHKPRRCGEHRTVGSHRAWCHDCGEWCYPALACAGCGPTREELEAQIEGLRAALTRVETLVDAAQDIGMTAISTARVEEALHPRKES